MLKPYAEHLAGISSEGSPMRAALEAAINRAAGDAAERKSFSVTIPPNTPREVVEAVKARYSAPPFNWPIRVSYEQRDGNTMYFGHAH